MRRQDLHVLLQKYKAQELEMLEGFDDNGNLLLKLKSYNTVQGTF